MSKKPVVALVDDNPLWLTTMARALAREGYGALLFGNPDDACRDIPEEKPLAIVSDYSMPSMTGVDLARFLRNEMGEQCPPMILVSGDLSELQPEQLVWFEAAYEKPVPLTRLMREVRRQVRGRLASGTQLQGVQEYVIVDDDVDVG